MSKFYIVTNYGEIVFWSTDREEAEFEYHQAIDQQICDHYRHDLPLKATEDIRDRFSDITFHEIDTHTTGQMLACELQEHFDRYYRETQEMKLAEAEREWKRAKELYVKYEDRLRAWTAQAQEKAANNDRESD